MNINQEFQKLIPALSEEEYNQLEQNIIADGCRDPLVVWNDTIVDGHNRYKICAENNIKFNTVQKEFDSESDVKMWMIINQFGRRNISNIQRVNLALIYKPLLAEQAEKNLHLSKGQGVKGLADLPKVKDPINTYLNLSFMVCFFCQGVTNY